jgi:hypothetical protein
MKEINVEKHQSRKASSIKHEVSKYENIEKLSVNQKTLNFNK